jgi:hypothetical protein
MAYCPWKDEAPSIKCRNSGGDLGPGYPGGKCQSDKECMSNNCQGNTCVGRIAGQSCSSNKDCVFGLACVASVCTAQKSLGVQCNTNAECLNSLVCFLGKCNEFFSQDDGTMIATASPFLCKSGFALKGECLSIKNSDTTIIGCDQSFPCNYTLSNGTNISIPDTCECGYNGLKQTYCFLGNMNNPSFNTYINRIQKMIATTDKCNAEEKRPGYCREYLRNDWNIKKLKITVDKDEIYAYNKHRLIEADYCVPQVVFGWDDTPPQPRDGKWQCPKFQCEGVKFDTKTCAYSINPFDEDGKNVTVYLSEKCGKREFCNYRQNLITGNWTTNHTCVSINRPDIKRKKYPGESCYDHKDCYNSTFNETIGYCIDGYCSGLKETDRCSSHRDCVAGNFCNGLYCEKQQGEKSFCIDQYHCKNNLACLNNSCTSLHSQKNGTQLGKSKPDSRLCEFGIMNPDGECIMISYRNMTSDKNGFIKCSMGQMCNYTTGQSDSTGESDLIQYPCQCGYNSEGQGYCGLSHDYRN